MLSAFFVFNLSSIVKKNDLHRITPIKTYKQICELPPALAEGKLSKENPLDVIIFNTLRLRSVQARSIDFVT